MISQIAALPVKEQKTITEKVALRKVLQRSARAALKAKVAFKGSALEVYKAIKKDLAQAGFTKADMRKVLRILLTTDYLIAKNVDKAMADISELLVKKQRRDSNTRAVRLAKRAKANLRAGKIGVAKDIAPLLDALFSLDPRLVADKDFTAYMRLMSALGENARVLTLPPEGTISTLAQRIVDNAEAAVEKSIERAAKDVPPFDVDEAAKIYEGNKISKEEIEAMDLTADEREMVEFFNDVSKDDITEMVDANGDPDRKKISELLAIQSNLGMGIVPHAAENMRLDISSTRRSKAAYAKTLNMSKRNLVSRIASLPKEMVKALLRATSLADYVSPSRSYLRKLNRNMANAVDSIFGNKNDSTIYNNTIGLLEEKYGAFDSDMLIQSAKLDDAAKLIDGKKKGNAIAAVRYKVMAYLLQLEYESNLDADGNPKTGTAPAAEWIDATSEHFGKLLEEGGAEGMQESINALQRIKAEFEVGGQISIDKLEKSFTADEKKGIALIQQVNESMAGQSRSNMAGVSNMGPPNFQSKA